MSFNTLIFVSGIAAVFLLFLIERLQPNVPHASKSRVTSAIFLEFLAKFFSFYLSYLFLHTYVNVIAPFQIFSISNLEINELVLLIVSILLVDFFHYLSHRILHKAPWFWRFHRLHHSDKSVDSLTSFIHHPLEVVAIFLVNVPMYVLFDIPVIAIFYHSLLMVIHSPFTHTTIKLNPKLDSFLSYFIITPNFHRVHHSLDMKEGNSSFGIVFPFWDRLFGTYIPKNQQQMNKLIFGIQQRESPSTYSVIEALRNPLK